MAGMSVDEAQIKVMEDLRSAKKEYTRLRDIAEKRIKRMSSTEFSQSKTYKEHRRGFDKLKDIDPKDLPTALSEVSKFVGAKASSITGQKEIMMKTIGTLNRAIGADSGEDDEDEPSGQAGVTKQNYWRVIKLLERARKLKKTYGSDKIVELADATLELSPDQFDVVLDNLEKMIEHVDDYKSTLSDYARHHHIKDYQVVDMDEFIEEIGW